MSARFSTRTPSIRASMRGSLIASSSIRRKRSWRQTGGVKVDRPKTKQSFPLMGLIFDDKGHPMGPSQSQKGDNRRYRYYVSRALIDKGRGEPGSIPRVPAQAIEDIVLGAMERMFGAQASVRAQATISISLHEQTERLFDGSKSAPVRLSFALIPAYSMPPITKHATHHDAIDALRARLATGCALEWMRDDLVLTIPIRAKFRGGQHHIIAPGSGELRSFPKPDATMVRAIVRAHAWLKLLLDGHRSVDGGPCPARAT